MRICVLACRRLPSPPLPLESHTGPTLGIPRSRGTGSQSITFPRPCRQASRGESQAALPLPRWMEIDRRRGDDAGRL